MSLTFVEAAPRAVREEIQPAKNLTSSQIEQIAEIFQTPLTGSYNWDYSLQDDRIKKLYELGKELNWNVETDLDWSQTFPRDSSPTAEELNPFTNYPPYQALSAADKLKFNWHSQANQLSQFLHGEQGALLVASQLVSCAPTYNAKLYAASQTFDEARHVEVFNKYIQTKMKIMYPINKNLKLILDKVLSDPRWDLKFIGMQVIIEGLALAAFNTMQMSARDPLLRQLVGYVIRDEARHVTFGINYLEEFVKALSDEEKEARALFAYETCVIMRERLISTDVFDHFGWNAEEAREYVLQGEFMKRFRNLLFTRVMPNLKRIGLLTDKIRPKFEELGILQFENFVDDGVIDWVALQKPLRESVVS